MATYDDQLHVPRWNLQSDEDITFTTFLVWKAIPHEIIHVKSHQDDNTEWEKLYFQAILNISADEQATRQRNTMNSPATQVRNLSRVQLRINDIAITRDSQQWILKSAGRIPVEQYYKEKFGWTKQIFDSIQWETQLKVLRSLTPADQTRIVKFIHGWLPTQKRLHMDGSARIPRCLLCTELVKDNIHLLNCKHPRMQDTQHKISQHLEKSLHDHGNSELTNLLEIGLISCTNREWTANLDYVSKEWKEAIREQNEIGWIHLYRGRIARTMIQAMNEHYSSLGVNSKKYTGERWAKRLIHNIWKTVLELWTNRNELIHDKESSLKEAIIREKTSTRIQRCYDFKELLNAKERQ
jgi:hypothetical protein